MNFRPAQKSVQTALILACLFACTSKKAEVQQQLASLDLTRGEINLCGSGTDQFGTVDFSLACSDKVRADFNLATALLHSFEYPEAEKVFAKVMDQDPECVMAYWGAAMCNFHSLWSPPGPADLEKGLKIVTLARSIVDDKSSRESDYLEAIATIYDDWQTQDYATRLKEYEQAARKVFEKYPDDKEAAIFYALALRASADPADKTFVNQKKAGDILAKMFVAEPNHPGIAHYLIHNYDYPELAELGLPAARKYASIAAASAHAQHMPSHIFTRLGLWDEAITSNVNSVSSAQCYAQNLGAKGHWDEEIHGLDYLIYAYLQKGSDDKAKEQMDYLMSFEEVFPVNLKEAYAFASVPARYALERRDWAAAAALKMEPSFFPWEKFDWERSNIHFARLLGDVHLNKMKEAKTELEELKSNQKKLTDAKESYKANLVSIQVKACEAWIKLKEGQKKEAIALMTEAADMEDATEKHPVTPGEVIPARELLGDLYFEAGDFKNAMIAYENNLIRHPNRYNGLYGAAQAALKSGEKEKATKFYQQLQANTNSSVSDRPQMEIVKFVVAKR
jgi:tetratricopeptide (TPR) repeat protein